MFAATAGRLCSCDPSLCWLVPYRHFRMASDSECTKTGIRSDRGRWTSSAARDFSCVTISSPKRIDQPAYDALHRISARCKTDHAPLAAKACGGQDKPTYGSGSIVALIPSHRLQEFPVVRRTTTWGVPDIQISLPHGHAGLFHEFDLQNLPSVSLLQTRHRDSALISKVPNGASLAFERYFFIAAAPASCLE